MNKRTPEFLAGVNTPPVAFRRSTINDVFFRENSPALSLQEQLILGELQAQKLDKMIQVLEHPELARFIQEGKITFAAIKPRTLEDTKLGEFLPSDEAGASFIRTAMRKIAPSLKVVFQVSVPLTKEDVGYFYEDVREAMFARGEQGEQNWQDMGNYMRSGAVTYMLLYDESGNAVQKWRNVIGSTDPRKASPNTIRGQFAYNIGRNLVHGASGDTLQEKVANVTREVNFLHDKLGEIRNASQSAGLKEQDLRRTGLLQEGQELVIARKIEEIPTQSGASVARYQVVFSSESGRLKKMRLQQVTPIPSAA